MARQLTEADARHSLAEHARAKGYALYHRYGTPIGIEALRAILDDRELIRYPCTIVFGAEALEPGECAYPVPLSEKPEDGFTITVHPLLADHPDWVVHVVLYQMVAVNYGDFASPADAEAFGAAALGLTEDQYYARLCTLADAVLRFDQGGVAAIPDSDIPLTKSVKGSTG